MALVACAGNVIQFSMQNTINSDEKYIEIDVFHFSKSCRTFTRTMKKSLPLGLTGTEFEFVCVKSFLNSTTGMYQIGLLLRQCHIKHASTEQFHVLLLEDYDSLFLLGSFETEASQTSDIEFYFIDGPAVCWNLQGAVYFARYNSTLERFIIDSVAVDNSMNEQLGIEFNLLWCGLIKNQMITMGSRSEMGGDASPKARWTCVNHHQNDVQEIQLVPDVYVPIATCCLVRESIRLTSACFNSIFDGLDVYVATNRGQLLNFANGHLKSCWQLPFNDPCRIWTLEVIFKLNGKAYPLPCSRGTL